MLALAKESGYSIINESLVQVLGRAVMIWILIEVRIREAFCLRTA